MGNVAANAGDYERSLQLYREGVRYCNNESTKKLLVTLYNNIANIYKLQGELELSMKNYNHAVALADKYPAELPRETLYSNIAGVLAQSNQPTKALYYLDKAEELALEHNNYYSLSDIYNNKGTAYESLKKIPESEEAFRSALTLARKYRYINVQYIALVNLGIIQVNDNKPDKALSLLKEAESLKGTINPYYQHLLFLAMGKAYLQQGSYGPSEQYLWKALKVSEQLNNVVDLVRDHGVLAELYEKTNNYESAFHHLSLEKKLNDSLNLKEMADNVAKIEVKYRTEQKNKELASKQLIIDRQQNEIYVRNFWIVAALAGLLLLLVLMLVLRKGYLNKQILKDTELKSLTKQQELKEIKAKVAGEEMERTRIARDLHDDIMVRFATVKMNLSALTGTSSIVLRESLNPVITQLDDATAALRRTAHNLMPDMLLQEGLAEAVYYFCSHLQQNAPFRIEFQQLGDLPRMDVQFELVVYRIMQELLQNILKHAKATEAIVQLSYNQKLLSITVEDNGIGIPKEAFKKNDAMGLKSIKARVADFNGVMEIESHEQVGTSIRIEFDNHFVS